jgi:6-phosphogluconolactonase (cycloisomerase 2 family)
MLTVMTPHTPFRAASRRGFLKTAASLAAAPALAAGTLQAQAKSPVLAYVGTYSSPEGPEGAKGRGQGIYLFEMNPATGALKQRELFADDSNPSWLAFDASRTHLYAANETSNFEGERSGSVSAWAIDRASGHLNRLNTVSSHGAGPCHLSVHPAGKFVFVANYHGGTVAVLPVGPGGELGPATDVHESRGTVGPEHAPSAPPGSFAISGHERTHAHMIQSDPSGRFVLYADLGLDQILVWKFDPETGKLTPNDPPYVALPPGDGPRHFTFHPNGRWLYSLQEEASTLVTFDYDAAHGKLTARQTISSLPKGFAGTDFTSEVMVSPDGRFVYAANRLHDSIAWFPIAKDGTLTFAGEQWTRGNYPRSFNIDPSGQFLYSCNQRADAIVSFRIDRKTGALAFTGQYTPVGTPAIIIFLT